MMILRSLSFILLSALCFLDAAFALSSSHQVEIKTSYLNFAEVKNTDQKNHIDLRLGYKSKLSFSKVIKANISAGAYVASYPDYAFTLPEAETVFFFDASSIRLGRTKVKHLSYLDSDWFLGVQTAFLRMNPLYPEEQGRVGVSYRFESDQVYGEFYGSPISVPDQFPDFKVSDFGLVSSDNPWSRLPPERVVLNTGAELDLSYELVDNSVPELLFDHQFGGTLGVKTDYLEIVGMYSNRPSKKLDFLLDVKIQAGASGLVEVKTKPIFLREHFWGVQTYSKLLGGFHMKNGFYGLILQDDGNEFAYQTSHPDYFFITTGFSLKWKSYDFLLQHLYTKERENVKDGVAYISASRFLYQNVISFTMKNLWYENLKSNVGGIYSYKKKIARFFLESTYQKNKNWAFWGRVNLVHSFDDEEVVDEGLSISSELESFAALDSINLGVSYVF